MSVTLVSMALSQTAEYALRAVVWLAQHPGDPQTTAQISDSTQVPTSYLPKVLQPLVRANVVRGQRGTGGGYSLVRPPMELTLLEVVNCVDPIQRIETCPLSLATHGKKLCPLHSHLNQVIIAEESRLSAVKVGELLGSPGQMQPLCEIARDLADSARDERDGASADPTPPERAEP